MQEDDKMSDKLQAVVAGHFCFDVIPAFKKDLIKDSMADIFIPGKLINMDTVSVSTGGPVSNTGIAMSILGADVSLMGKIGDDMFGDATLKELEKTGHDMVVEVNHGCKNTKKRLLVIGYWLLAIGYRHGYAALPLSVPLHSTLYTLHYKRQRHHIAL